MRRKDIPGAAVPDAPEIDALTSEAVALLSALIRTPSFSREEDATADLLASWFGARGMTPHRTGNNVWLRTPQYDPAKPSLLLCSHHDTVRPVSSWEGDPFDPRLEDGRLTGLGSNDAGASAVVMSLVYAVLHSRADLPFNLHLALSAEEEVAGEGGIVAMLEELGAIDLAVVGEPTGMELAVAEKGLLVLDGTANGVAGHAARSTGVNAISVAMRDLAWIEQWTDPRPSPRLGQVRMSVTQISAGSQHNVVPDRCDFVVDVRVTDLWTHEDLLAELREGCASDLRPRSMRLRPSSIPAEHPVVRAAEQLGIPRFASPTMSDQALLPFPSVKIGPGRSERSHTAGEYILVDEIAHGLRTYFALLERYAELIA